MSLRKSTSPKSGSPPSSATPMDTSVPTALSFSGPPRSFEHVSRSAVPLSGAFPLMPPLVASQPPELQQAPAYSAYQQPPMYQQLSPEYTQQQAPPMYSRGPMRQTAAPAPTRGSPAPRSQVLSNSMGPRDFGRPASAPVPEEDPIDEKAVLAAAARATAPAQQDGDATPPALTLTTACEYDTLLTSSSSNVLSMASLSAPAMKLGSDRVPLDLVAVLDISGSMSGSKISMLCHTMNFIVQQMTASDRLALIPFNSSASYATPLVACSADGKAKLTEAIKKRLVAGGGTDIAAGMSLAGEMLRVRKQTNSVTSVLLLTDGMDGGALGRLPSILERYPAGVTAHTFGFGADHDVAVLTKISDMAHGIYSYIERTDMVGDAFAGCLGGLLSVFAQQISLQITTPADSRIVSVRTHYTHRIAPDGKSAVIELGDIYAEESRDLLFQIEAPEVGDDVTATPLFTAELTYVRTGDTAGTTTTSVLSLPRGPVSVPTRNAKLDQQRNRIIATEAMTEAVALADAGRFDAAREKLAAARTTVEASPSYAAGDSQVRQLSADIEASASRMRDRGVYAAGGNAYARSNMMQYQQQRAQHGSAASPMYANSSAQYMQQAYHQ